MQSRVSCLLFHRLEAFARLQSGSVVAGGSEVSIANSCARIAKLALLCLVIVSCWQKITNSAPLATERWGITVDAQRVKAKSEVKHADGSLDIV